MDSPKASCALPAPAGVLWPALGTSALGIAALGIANALVLVWGGSHEAAGSTARQLIAVLLGTSLGGAAVLWIALDQRFARLPLRWVLGLALLLRLIAIQASPLLEDDHFRYLWDGLRTATALDPYRLPPAAFFGASALSPAWQDVLSGINNPDVPTLYGPVLQWLFAAAYWLMPAKVFAIQALLLVVDMAVLFLLAHQGVGTRGLLVYAVHPLVLKEAMASAHPDGLVALLLLLALMAWQKRSAAVMGVMLGLAVCAKVAALVVLPLLWLAPPRRPADGPVPTQPHAFEDWPLRAIAGSCLAVVALYLPFAWVGGSDASGLATFGTQWRYNPLLYRLVELVLPGPATRPAAAFLIVAGTALLAWRWRSASRHFKGQALPPLDLALVLLILLSPVVNPWYWLWALALSVRLGQGWLAVATVTAPLAYLNSTVLAETTLTFFRLPEGPFAVAGPAVAAQLLALGLAWRYRRRLQL